MAYGMQWEMQAAMMEHHKYPNHMMWVCLKMEDTDGKLGSALFSYAQDNASGFLTEDVWRKLNLQCGALEL